MSSATRTCRWFDSAPGPPIPHRPFGHYDSLRSRRGLLSMRYKGIVFDFNGVLFWDADLQVKSWQVIAKDLRGHEMTDDELDTHMHGRPNSYVLRYLAGRTIAGQELLDLIQV